MTEDRAAAGCNGETDGYRTFCFLNDGTWLNDKYWFADEVWFSDSAGPRYKNDWHFVDVYLQLNSIQNGSCVSDGVARYWYDGTLVLDLQRVLFRTGSHPDMRFNQFIIGPWIGAGSSVTQTVWIDDRTIASSR